MPLTFAFLLYEIVLFGNQTEEWATINAPFLSDLSRVFFINKLFHSARNLHVEGKDKKVIHYAWSRWNGQDMAAKCPNLVS